MINLVDNFNRGDLNEGRTTGMGYAFLRKLDTHKFETVFSTFSCCREYLNDTVYNEMMKMGREEGVHGYKHPKYVGYFEDTDHFYLGINSQPKSNGKYSDKEHHQFLLKHAIGTGSFIKNLNWLDDKIGFTPTKAVFTGESKDKNKNPFFVLKVDVRWAQNPWLISLYSEFIRIICNTPTPINLSSITTSVFTVMMGDAAGLKTIIQMLRNPTARKRIVHNYPWTDSSGEPHDVYDVHGRGFRGFIKNYNKGKVKKTNLPQPVETA